MGYAYIEFANHESVDKAVELLNESLFFGRQILVTRKRVNIPGKKRVNKAYKKYTQTARPVHYMNNALKALAPLLALTVGNPSMRPSIYNMKSRQFYQKSYHK